MGFDLATMLKTTETLTTSDHKSVVSINLFVTLLCACIVIGHLLEENRWMNESITALIVGVGTGVVILLISGGKSSHLMVFSEDLFFIYLLPPIIFNAGFQVKKKQFFRNFMTIMLFGAVGTMISFVIISSAKWCWGKQGKGFSAWWHGVQDVELYSLLFNLILSYLLFDLLNLRRMGLIIP